MASRKGSQAVLWVLFALLAAGLLGYGTGGFGTRRDDIGTVGGLDVPARSYVNAVNQQMQQLQQALGQPLPFAQAQALGIDRAALSQVVTERVLDAEAARLGLSVGDERVARAVRGEAAFQGIDGTFDRDLYTDQLRRNGLDEEAYEAGLRAGSVRTLLQAAVLSGLPEPAAYAEALATWANERRVVTWATLSAESVAPGLAAPTEAELTTYYEAHPEAFTAPEVRDVAYAWITPAMLADVVEVEDQAVRDLYDARLDEYVQEERRLVERLAFGSEEEAAEAKARIDAGEADFEAVVEGRGLQLSDTDMGDVGQGELGAAGEAVFAAAVGDVVGPVLTDLGPALFRVNAVLAADEVPFEEAAPELREELAFTAAQARIDEALPEVEDLIAGGASVEDLAERTDLEAGTLEWTEAAAEGIAAYGVVREAITAAEPGSFPDVVRLDDGGIAVLRVDAVTPPALRPYEEVAEQVTAALQAERLAAAVLAEAEAKAAALAEGASFEDQGLAPTTEPPLTRRDVVEDGPPGLIERAFALPEGGAAAMAAGADAVVLRVDSVAPPAEDDAGLIAEREAVAAEASSALARDLFAAYAAALQTGTEVRIDDAAVAAINAQFQQDSSN